jgi:alpha-tubulin suppressor-like RCC1 family protein
VLAGKTITHISAGAGATDGGEAQHTCVAASGKAYCWGYNSLGRLGDGTTTNSSVPVAVNTSGVMAGKVVSSVTTGYRHTCAVASGQAFCWGYNSLGRLGDGTTTNSLVPVAVNISGVLAGKTVTDGYEEADPIYDILLY